LDEARCYWEHVGEPIGNLGTHWENSKNLTRIHWEQQKSKPLTSVGQFKEITKEGKKINIGLIMLEG